MPIFPKKTLNNSILFSYPESGNDSKSQVSGNSFLIVGGAGANFAIGAGRRAPAEAIGTA